VADPTAVSLVHWDEAAECGAVVAVTTRHGGVSEAPYGTLNLGLHVGDRPGDVVTNRTRAATAFGVGLRDMVFAGQVHGATAALAGPGDRGRGTKSQHDAVPDADILMTTSPGVTLVMLVADCVPIALFDPTTRIIAAVHAGWRGTAAGVVARALRAMEHGGARPDRVMAFLGPAVHPDRYQVSDDVLAALSDAVRPAALDGAVARPDGPGHWLIDLVAANRQQLLRGGVRPEHIAVCGATTADEAFFSDRAERPCGRFALLARLAD
jgi:hypothetical protein